MGGPCHNASRKCAPVLCISLREEAAALPSEYAPEHLEKDPGHFEKDFWYLPPQKGLVTPLTKVEVLV